MKRMRALVSVLPLLLIGVTPLAAEAEDELTAQLFQHIEAADSPEDHEAISRIYKKAAAEVWGRVDVHKKILFAYEQKTDREWNAALEHCGGLMRQYSDIALAYEALATEHEREAGALRVP